MISLSLWMEKLIDFCQVLYGIFCGDNWLIIGLDLVGSSELFFRIFSYIRMPQDVHYMVIEYMIVMKNKSSE